jgi:hypothetical protein
MDIYIYSRGCHPRPARAYTVIQTEAVLFEGVEKWPAAPDMARALRRRLVRDLAIGDPKPGAIV